MKSLQFAQLLAVSAAVLLGRNANAHPTATPPAPYTTVASTTTSTTTQIVTVTQTTTVVETKTRETPCPAYETGILAFDDLHTSGSSPMPLIYKDFIFPTEDAWQYYDGSTFPHNSLEYAGVISHPNALLSDCTGLSSISSLGRGFSFDLISVEFTAHTPKIPDGQLLIIEIVLLGADGYEQAMYLEHPNNASMTELFEPAAYGVPGFTDLVEISIAAWQTYDNTTGEGVAAGFVLDDIKYVKRKCGSY